MIAGGNLFINQTMKPFEYIEHTADAGMRVCGEKFENSFYACRTRTF